MVRMSVQASDQQGAPAGRDRFPKLSNPFCKESCLLSQHRGSESVETRKLHSVERLDACLVFQKLLGLLAGCLSSGPPPLPTLVRTLSLGAQEGTFLIRSLCFCQPSVGGGEAVPWEGGGGRGEDGSAAPGQTDLHPSC